MAATRRLRQLHAHLSSAPAAAAAVNDQVIIDSLPQVPAVPPPLLPPPSRALL